MIPESDDTFVGGVGLEGDAAVGVGEDKVSVGVEGEGGVIADGAAAVGLPDPAEKRAAVRGVAHADGEGVGARGGVVEADGERAGEHDRVPVRSVVLEVDVVAEVARVDELERGIFGD